MRPPTHDRRARERGSSSAAGFTMIEVITVAVVMGTLVRIATPNLHDVVLEARAAEVAGDFETVRLAALNYHADRHAWPVDAYAGQVPSGLDRYLPEGYGFVRAGYRLDWENWALPNGLPLSPSGGVLLGISIVTQDAELGRAVLELLGSSNANYRLGDTYTFVIERD